MEANPELTRSVYASVPTRVGTAALCDLRVEDVDDIVRFWYESGDALLDFLGIDRRLLGTSTTPSGGF
jgi:hypothetical protein